MKGMEARSYAVDFTKCTEVQWSEIKSLVQQEEVSVLGMSSILYSAFGYAQCVVINACAIYMRAFYVVNNVGLCHENPTFFDEEEQDKCNDMVEVNVNTMMDLTRIVVPQMQQRKNGLIINLGSFAAIRSMPFLSVYAGTKGF
ncbi:hypothetical protein GGI13_007891, partial [Coemansia sp. RSA 455]